MFSLPAVIERTVKLLFFHQSSKDMPTEGKEFGVCFAGRSGREKEVGKSTILTTVQTEHPVITVAKVEEGIDTQNKISHTGFKSQRQPAESCRQKNLQFKGFQSLQFKGL